ncbi:MAG: hypothetical protein RLY31_1173 [Bacteroidota bacterium]|jgi:carboxyl-terminal processing protease
MNADLFPTHRKINVWLPLLLSFVMTVGMWAGSRMNGNPPRVKVIKTMDTPPADLAATPEGIGRFEELIRYIDARYVEDLDREKLVSHAIGRVMDELDPHSAYFTESDLREANRQLEGGFYGIGIEYMTLDDTIVVLSVLPDGPAAAAGLLAGDKIVSLDDSLIIDQTVDNEGMLDYLRGEQGARVRVGILRGAEPSPLTFVVERDFIAVNSVEAAYMLDAETGYLRINRFSTRTYEEFMKALESLVERQGMKHLVLDLRRNGGGYLQEATRILSQLFAEKDKLLVYTEGERVPRNDYKSTGHHFFDIGNIVLLTDEGSASASEIIAGALQDWDRGVVIGRRTFGKGLVQEQYLLRDGSAVRLTVARYFTPAGRCIQRPYADRDAYELDMEDRIRSGEVYDGAKMLPADTTRYFTGNGRVVYGGGGIMPDIFIPLDSTAVNPHLLRLQEYIPAFLLRRQGASPAEGMTLERFLSDYRPDASLLADFRDYTRSRGDSCNERQWRLLRPAITLQVKAALARQTWSDEGYFRAINSQDPAIAKALEVIRNPKPYLAPAATASTRQ